MTTRDALLALMTPAQIERLQRELDERAAAQTADAE